MDSKARFYTSTVIAFGVVSVVAGLKSFQILNPALFAAILALSVATSLLKVRIPGIQGSMSMNFIFIMLGVTRLSLGETLTIGIAATVVQTFWHSKKRLRLTLVSFNVALIAAVITISHVAFQSPIVRSVIPGSTFRLWFIAGLYFVLNTGTVAGIIALTESRTIWTVWKGSYGWSFAYFWLGASAVSIFNLIEQTFGLEIALLVVPIAFLAYRSYRVRIESLEKSRIYAEEQRRHAEELAAIHLRTIRALALAIEVKDTTTGEHLHRVQTYALGIARKLDLSEDELQAVSAASILHDIGKIAVPESIISKPGKLSREEFEIMKIHPVVGGEITESVRFPFPVAPIVSAHHEKWDGTGYPYGLKGEEIPIGARIISAVDCLDALASDRQYRRAMPLEKAMEIVRSESGKAFDPKVVDILDKHYGELEALARSTLTEDAPQLSISAKIERGSAPGTGLEQGLLNHCRNRLDTLAESQRESELLVEVERLLMQGSVMTDLMERLIARLRQAMPIDSAVFFLREDNSLVPNFVAGTHSTFLRSLKVEVGEGMSGWVAEHRIPLINGNPATESGRNGNAPRDLSLKSGLAVPLETEEGVFGVLTLYSEKRDAYQGCHLRLCLGFRSRLAFGLRSALSASAERNEESFFNDAGFPNMKALLSTLDGRLESVDETGGLQVLAVRFAETPAPQAQACLKTWVAERQPFTSFLARVAERDFIAIFQGEQHSAFSTETDLTKVLKRAGFASGTLVGSAEAPFDQTHSEGLIAKAVSRFRAFANDEVDESILSLLALGKATMPEGGTLVRPM